MGGVTYYGPATRGNIAELWQQLLGQIIDHINEDTGAHRATAISVSPTVLGASQVQSALTALAVALGTTTSDLAAHLADAIGAHAASAIAFTPAGSIAAATVQAAIVEVATEYAAAIATEAADRATADNLRILLTEKAAANGVATLGADSKVPAAQIPNLAIGETFNPVVSQAAMLALTAQRGDVAIRTDLNPDGVYWLAADDPTQLANWVRIGAVDLSSDGAANVPSLRTLGTGATQALPGNTAFEPPIPSGTYPDSPTPGVPKTALVTEGDQIKTSGKTDFRGPVFTRDPIIDVRSYRTTNIDYIDNDTWDAAVAAIPAGPSEGRTLLLRGPVNPTATLVLADRDGAVVEGTSRRGDIIQPSSALAGLPVLLILNCGPTTVRRLAIKGYSGAAPSAAIESRIDTTTLRVDLSPTGNRYENLTLGSDSPASLVDGILHSATAVDQNNDQSGSLGVIISNITGAGWRLSHGQSVGHVISGSSVNQCAHGVSTHHPTGAAGGSFYWLGGGGGIFNASEACFEILNSLGHPVLVAGLNSERCKRLLVTNNSPTLPITLLGGGFSCDSLHADGWVILHQGPGPLSLDNFKIYAGSVLPRIKLTNPVYPGVARFSNLSIRGAGPNLPLDVLGGGGCDIDAKGTAFLGPDAETVATSPWEVWHDDDIILMLDEDGVLSGSALPVGGSGDVTTADVDQSLNGVKSFLKRAIFALGLRIANDVFLTWRKADNSADINVMKLNSGNDVEFDGANSYQWQKPAVFNDNITITGFKQIQWQGGFYWTPRISGTQWQMYSAATGDIPLALNESSASGETAASLLVNDGSTTTLRRVKVGAAGSGPGGSGHALYVD